MTEQALAQAWLERRDADAFQGLCEKHAGMVYATALRMLRNSADAEDVTQECFLRLARPATSIRGSLGAWLHRVAVNLAIDRMRRDTSRRAREETFADLSPATTEVTWNDLREHVDAAINELPDHVRDTIVAHFIEGVSQQAIADAEGVTRSAVSQRINRALQMVRTTLEKRGVSVSLTALTALLTAHLAEAIAVPAGLTASLGNLAVYAGASNAAAGVAAGLLSVKGIAAIVAALLALGGIGFAALRLHETPGVQTAVVHSETTAAAVPVTASSFETERAGRDNTSAPAPEPTVAAPAAVTGATVEGFVREQDTGRPLQGVRLVCQPDDGTRMFQYSDEERVLTDQKGRYRITDLAPGRYKLLCSSSWHTRDPGDTQDYEVELRFAKNESIRLFEVADAPAQSGPNFEVIVGETISGIAVDTAGNPVADAEIVVRGASTYLNAQTAANGWFKAGGFPVTDEVMLFASKGKDIHTSVRTEPDGTTKALPPDREALVSDIIGPLTMPEDGLRNVRLTLRNGASVSGHLSDHLGQPLAKVNVMARSTASNYMGSRFGKTDDNGDFVLPAVAEGEYDLAWNPRKLEVDEQTYGWAPYEAQVLKHIEVTWDQHFEGLHLRADDSAEYTPNPENGWNLAGRIRDVRGKAIEGASVYANEIAMNEDRLTTKSESDGRYQLAGLHEGHYYLFRVSHPDYSTYMNSLTEPVAGEMDIVLEDRGIVSGQVRYGDSGMPVTSFYISMLKGNNEPVLMESEEGRFRVEGADAGDNAVVVSAEGYRETHTPVTVLSGREVAGVEARLERGLVVEGIVVDEKGVPMEGAHIFTGRVPSFLPERDTQAATITDADGRFRVENLAKDSGTISAWHPEFGMGAAFYDAVASEIEIVLRNNMGTVSGSVLAEGQVPSGAQISLMPVRILSAEAAAFGSPNRRIKEDGAFRFDDVPEGEYNVSVTIGKPNVISPMGRNLTQRITVESGAETEVLLDLPPEESSVEGRILVQGEPISQGFVLLTLESSAGKQTHTAQVAEDGSYVISPIAAGHATLRSTVVIQAPFSSVSQTLEFEITPGEAVYRDINFDARGTVRGTVRGVPADRQLPITLLKGTVDLGEVTLETVLAVSQDSIAGTMVQGPGAFEFPAVPPGEYTVFAWLSNSSGRVEGFGTAPCSVPAEGTPVTVALRFQSQ